MNNKHKCVTDYIHLNTHFPYALLITFANAPTNMREYFVCLIITIATASTTLTLINNCITLGRKPDGHRIFTTNVVTPANKAKSTMELFVNYTIEV